MIEAQFKLRLESFPLEIAFQLPTGSVLALFGPSGCGKSMTLRSLAGLVRPDEGFIKMDEAVFYDSSQKRFIPARRRRIGFLFQDYALFPHLTVEKNIGFGLKHLTQKEKKQKVHAIMERMRLSGLENRYPDQLSGGQRQRVALARTLVTDPSLLLLDEPFSALDRQVKKKLEKEVLDIRDAFSGTILLVTHSLDEAYRMCSHIAIMEKGRILQLGSRDDILYRPLNRTVARLTGTENIFDGVVTKREGQNTSVWVEELKCHLSFPYDLNGESISLGIRPSQIKVLTSDEVSPEFRENLFSGRVVQSIPGPDGQTLYIKLEHRVKRKERDYDVQAQNMIQRESFHSGLFQAGDPCQVYLPPYAFSFWSAD